MGILHLTLKKKWFDKITKGEKVGDIICESYKTINIKSLT